MRASRLQIAIDASAGRREELVLQLRVAMKGDITQVKKYIGMGGKATDVLSRDRHKWLLISCIMAGEMGSVAYLVKTGVELNRIVNRTTCLNVALTTPRLSKDVRRWIVDLLVRSGADIAFRERILLPLHKAVHVDDPALIRECVKAGADLDMGDMSDRDYTPLMEAILCKRMKAARALASLGAYMTESMAWGVMHRDVDTVTMLIEEGVDVHVCFGGASLLDYLNMSATADTEPREETLAILRLLTKNGVVWNTAWRNEAYARLEVMDIIMEHDKDALGPRCLHEAVATDAHVGAACRMIIAGADPTRKEFGLTPAEFAKKLGYVKWEALMKRAEVRWNAASN